MTRTMAYCGPFAEWYMTSSQLRYERGDGSLWAVHIVGCSHSGAVHIVVHVQPFHYKDDGLLWAIPRVVHCVQLASVRQRRWSVVGCSHSGSCPAISLQGRWPSVGYSQSGSLRPASFSTTTTVVCCGMFVEWFMTFRQLHYANV